MKTREVKIETIVDCECELEFTAFFDGQLRKRADEWIILVPRDQETACHCGRKHRPGDPRVVLPISVRIPVNGEADHSREITAEVFLADGQEAGA